jgi:hypothetical protein
MKTKIEVEVEIDETGEVVGLTIGAGPPYVMPLDKPMPRRFARDLAEAAGRKLRGDAEVTK